MDRYIMWRILWDLVKLLLASSTMLLYLSNFELFEYCFVPRAVVNRWGLTHDAISGFILVSPTLILFFTIMFEIISDDTDYISRIVVKNVGLTFRIIISFSSGYMWTISGMLWATKLYYQVFKYEEVLFPICEPVTQHTLNGCYMASYCWSTLTTLLVFSIAYFGAHAFGCATSLKRDWRSLAIPTVFLMFLQILVVVTLIFVYDVSSFAMLLGSCIAILSVCVAIPQYGKESRTWLLVKKICLLVKPMIKIAQMYYMKLMGIKALNENLQMIKAKRIKKYCQV